MQRVSYEQLPANVQADIRRLHDLCDRGRQEDAIAGLAAVVSRFPGYTTASFLLGRALRARGDICRARQAFEAAAQVAPDDPDVRMGLAWARLDADDYVEAVRFARTLLESRTHRGDALAIQARAVEAQGDLAAAARLFLEAYEANPMIPWLEAHARLVGAPFSLDTGRAPRAWPITPAQRLWLFRSVERAVVANARAKGPSLPPDKLLLAGCDHTPRLTRRWANAANIDVLPLYQALAARGGFCDCEVLMNAAREDDEALESVLVSGMVVGDTAAAVHVLGELFAAGHAASPPLSSDTDEDERGDQLLYQSFDSEGDTTLRIGLQLVGGMLLGHVLETLALSPLPSTVSRLLLAYPDLGGSAELVTVRDGKVDALRIGDGELPAGGSTQWLKEDLVAIRAVAPPSGPRVWQGRIGLPSAGPTPRLILRDKDERWFVADMQGGAIEKLDVTGRKLTVSPDGRRVAWLTSYRKIVDLVVEEVGRGERTRIERGTISRRLSFAPDARTLYAVVEGYVTSFDLVTGERRVIGPGSAATVSPDGQRLIVETDGEFAVWSAAGQLLRTVRGGRSPVWAGDSRRLAFLARPENEGWQAFAFDVDKSRAWRVSPPCEESCWPSFSASALVVYIRKARRRVPVAGGRVRLEDDEAVVQCSLDLPGEVVTLSSSDGGYMRIVNPVAHGSLPLVAFCTQDAPQVGRRVVVVERGGPQRTIAEGTFTPVAWLD